MKKNIKWTREAIQEVANRYDNKTKFIAIETAAVAAAYRLNVMDEISSHMESKFRRFNDDVIIETTSKYNSMNDFKRADYAMYKRLLTINKLRLYTSHMVDDRKFTKIDDKFSTWSDEELLKIINKYNSTSKLKEEKPLIYQLGIKRNLFTPMIDKKRKVYTNEMLINIINSYSSESKFKKGNKRLYSIAWTRGLVKF